MNREQVFAAMSQRVHEPAVLGALLHDVPGEVWRDVQAHALTHALTHALALPYYRERVDLTPARIAADPFAAVLAFPPLRKQDYWDHAAGLRTGSVAADHVFSTSGTEGGIPTEQPWDRWTFEKSFCESSALALTAVGARAGDRLLLGTPLHGALGLAFGDACGTLGIEVLADPLAFSDAQAFAPTLELVRDGVDLLVGAPGSLVMLIHRLRAAGVDTRALGVRGIVSGIGTFLTDAHVEHFVAAFAPERIHEQGGKNEILHAPGGLRYRRDQPAAICRPGFLHVLPWAAYVVAVDPAALVRGVRAPVGHEREGVLLMTRLSAGRPGCAAFVNDAGDFGMTLGFGGVDAPVSPCGCTMPAFRFMGRAGKTVENKIGESLFTEELVRALSLAARDVGLEPSLAVGLRIQAVLVRDADPLVPDSLFWVVGAPHDAWPAAGERLVAVARRWVERWPKHAVYRGPLSHVMGFGGFAVVDAAALPHAGRDKPQYPLALDRSARPGEPHAAAFEEHLRGTLGAVVLAREATP